MFRRRKNSAKWVLYVLTMLVSHAVGRKRRKKRREVVYRLCVRPYESSNATFATEKEAISLFLQSLAKEKGWGLAVGQSCDEKLKASGDTLTLFLLFAVENEVLSLVETIRERWPACSVSYVKTEQKYCRILPF